MGVCEAGFGGTFKILTVRSNIFTSSGQISTVWVIYIFFKSLKGIPCQSDIYKFEMKPEGYQNSVTKEREGYNCNGGHISFYNILNDNTM